MYDVGQGVPENPVKAFESFKQAARSDNPYAQYNLGNMYAEGRGVKRNLEKATSWYRKAAEQDLAIAQYSLGLLYAAKQGATSPFADKRRESAIKWLYQSGLSYIENRQIDEAAKAHQTMIEIGFKWSSHWNRLADFIRPYHHQLSRSCREQGDSYTGHQRATAEGLGHSAR
jgi:hypothetical protein